MTEHPEKRSAVETNNWVQVGESAVESGPPSAGSSGRDELVTHPFQVPQRLSIDCGSTSSVIPCGKSSPPYKPMKSPCKAGSRRTRL